MNEYYQVLGLPPEASTESIKKAFYQHIKQVHPDVARGAQSALKAQQLIAAYRALSEAQSNHHLHCQKTSQHPRANSQQKARPAGGRWPVIGWWVTAIIALMVASQVAG